MASTGYLLFMLVVVFISAGNGEDFVQIHCKPQNFGQYNQQSLLDCVVRTSKDVKGAEIQAVIWWKEGDDEPLLVFHQGQFNSSDHYSFAEPSWKNMNVSLLIHKTSVLDKGVYKCVVYTDSGSNECQTSLEVTAKYSVPTFQPDPETLNLDTGGALTCISSGYPKGTLHWFDKDNKEWIKSPETEEEQTENGLLRLSSTMTISRRSVFSKYICKVFNARGDLEGESLFEVPDHPLGEGQTGADNSSPSLATKIAPVVVIGSLIVGLLLWLLLLYRRKSKQARRLSATPLMSDRVRTCECEEGDSQEMEKIEVEA